MIGVYKITNPKNEMYIGQSCDIEKRFKQHKKKPCNKKLRESFLKYGVENHKFEVIIECEIDDLKNVEFEQITSHRLSFVLFNADDYESFAGRKKKTNEAFTVRCHPEVIADVRKYAKEKTEEHNNKQ